MNRAERQEHAARQANAILKAAEDLPPDAQAALQQVIRHLRGLLTLLEEQVKSS